MQTELIRRFLARYRRHAWVVVIASVIANLLVFAGSLYMLLVYDSVLPSRSLPTLFGLFGMLAIIYLIQGAIELLRSEAMLRLANGVHEDLVQSVHYAAVTRTVLSQREARGLQLTRDLDHVHAFLTSQGPIALIDLPWVVVFLVVLAALHWSLGLTALVGATILIVLAWITARRSDAGTRDLNELTSRRIAANQTELRFAEAALAMGMQDRLLDRAKDWDDRYLTTQSYLSRTVARLGGAGRLFRLFLQSSMLTVGALLVLDGKASGGVMLAASILAGRALAPVDQALANARSLSAARSGWQRLVDAIAEHPQPSSKSVSLELPSQRLAISGLWVAPPGSQRIVLSDISFAVERGQAVAVIGPSAAGKSTLVKALLGIWPLTRGEIRIDGATPAQWDRAVLGRSLGYVPQLMELLEGTVGENISRFEPDAPSEEIIAAARKAGMHETILALPNGYDTMLSTGGNELSAGQRQRVALARALYRDPFIVILDEPNSNLDAAGDAALAHAIEGVRQRDGIVVMVTHRPATLGPITHVAVLGGGKLIDFGERDPVLKRAMQAGQPPRGIVTSSLQVVAP